MLINDFKYVCQYYGNHITVVYVDHLTLNVAYIPFTVWCSYFDYSPLNHYLKAFGIKPSV